MTTLGQSGPGSNSNDVVFHIPQSSKTGSLLSDSLVSYLENIGEVSYPFAEVQLVYSTVLAERKGLD